MDGVGVGSHVSKLGTFFLMSLTLRMPNYRQKNLIGHDLWNVSKKITTSIEVKIAIKTLQHPPARVQ